VPSLSNNPSTLTQYPHSARPRDITKGKLDGRGVEIQRLICRAMRASIDLDRLGGRSGSIVTFCRRTAVLVPQRSRAAQSVMAVIEQVFSVLSHVEVSTGAKSSHLPLRRPKAVYIITPLSAKFGATLTVDGFMIASGCSADPDSYWFQ